MLATEKMIKLVHQLIRFAFATFFIGACTSTPESTITPPQAQAGSTPFKPANKSSPPNQEPSPSNADSPEEKALRSDFLAKPFLYFFMNGPTVNFLNSSYYVNQLPKATILGDYNQKPFASIMAVNFNSAFEKNLPPEILAELKKRDLLAKQAVDIAWVIQPLANLGGNSEGSVKNITYLKAHGWADPDGLGMNRGSGVNRNFLYGIFDADVDISHDVQLSNMKPFNLHTHDGMISPQTAALRLPNASPDSMALWSLAIDSENPEGKIRAIATLHWLISDKDLVKFKQESFIKGDIIDHRGKLWVSQRAVPFANIGDYISMLLTKSFLKDSALVKKLQTLLKP
jgi:hypothetical protein